MNKLTKSKIIKIMILLVITSVFILGIYGVVDSKVENKIIYNIGSTSPMDPLTDRIHIKQEINIKNENFNNIAIQTATYGRTNSGVLNLKLYKLGNEKPIVSKSINVNKFKNNEFLNFNFKNIKVIDGDKYYFTIQTTSKDENSSPTIWKNSDENDEFSLFINNEKTKGKICYMVGDKPSYKISFSLIYIFCVILIIASAYFSNEHITKKNIYVSGIFIVLSLVFACLNVDVFYTNGKVEYNYIMIILSIVSYIYYLLLYNNNLSEKYKNICTGILFFIIPFFSLNIIEVFNDNILIKMDTKIVGINYICILVLYIVLYLIINKINIALIIGTIICYLLGMTYYYVLLFRGSPILPTDLYAIKTAAVVVENYEFKIDLITLIITLIVILICVICRNTTDNFNVKKTRQKVKILALTGSVLFVGTANIWFNECGAEINLWNQNVGYKQNGVIVNFMMNTKYLKAEKPENYSIEKVNNIIEKIDFESADELDNNNNKSNKPNIIAIMNESFSDLSAISKFSTNKDYMPFIRNLNKNTVKGNLFVSAYGGGTSLSEWEFLTGNNSAFTPTGSIPYQQYIHADSNSLANKLKSLDYETLAIHPFHGEGWNRNKVYKLMGFDEFLTIDDFKNPEKLRDAYVSDRENYNKIIEKYEEKEENEKLFILNVTIQNHGGYLTDNSIFQDDIYLTDYNYEDVNEYLSLIKKSDEAFEELITYFSNQDEPTIILMFGDHLPSLNNKFYEDLYQKSLNGLTIEETQRRFLVPFVIWANYDIEEKYIDKISANYLSTLLLEVANQPLTGYNKFLKHVYSEIPVINKNGYIDSKGKYYKFEQNNNIQLIEDYKVLQYNDVFDTKNSVQSFFK